jgi:DNA-binding GntR family transcriptional regulator
MRLARVGHGTSPRSLVQIAVYNRLKSALLSGRFRPGTVLSIRKMAEQLQTSTMPVREAVARLVSERALEMLSNHGVRVPILTRARAHEIYEARVALEGLAAANAAKHIDVATMVELEDIQRRLDTCATNGQLRGVLVNNLQFHSTLIRAARSQTLLALTDSLYLQWVPTLMLSIEKMTEPRAEFIHTHHAPILRALRDHDAAAAKTALESDLSDFRLSDAYFSAIDTGN